MFELSDGPRTYVQLFGDCWVAGLGRDSRMEVAPGVGGGDCGSFGIDERGCGYVSGYPAL